MSTVNLLPENFLQRRAQSRANVVCLMLFGAVMIGVATAAVVSSGSIRNTARVRDRVAKDYAEAARMIEVMHSLKRKRHNLMEKAEQTASLMERVPRSYVLAAVNNARPENVSLRFFGLQSEVTRKKPAPAKPATKGKAVGRSPHEVKMIVSVKIMVKGYAATDLEVARFIANLARNPLMKSVDLVYSKAAEAEGQRVRDFQLNLRTAPNFDVMNILEKGEKSELEELASRNGGNR